jgi:hypothetical protein
MKAYLLLLLALASYATERYAPVVDAKVDSGIPPLAVHKLKFTGPVTIQVGQGNSSQVGTNKTGQRAQAVSTGASSPVQASQNKSGVTWWIFVLVGVANVIGWEWLRRQVVPLGRRPWRAKSG